jgi:hypothetical protein
VTTDLVAGVLFLAPGFLALTLFYLLGAQRKRSEWEWTTWSVIASLPITGLASLARDYFSSARTDPDPIEVVLRMLIGAAAGVVCGVVWAGIRHSKRDVAGDLRTFFGSSAWDEALEDVGREGRQVELVLEDGCASPERSAMADERTTRQRAGCISSSRRSSTRSSTRSGPPSRTVILCIATGSSGCGSWR